MKEKKYAVISLSGGMDSSTLLLRLLAEGYIVTAVSFDYGQKHKIELEKATELVGYLNQIAMAPLEDENDVAPFTPINHEIIELGGLSKLISSNLVEGGKDVPEGHYEEDNMKDTVVPNRNKIFSSIIQAIALSIANQKKTKVHIAMGIHAGDHSIYPDCRAEFRDADYKAFLEGNWDADRVTYYTPYLSGDKLDILKDGERCCEELGLDFNVVYLRTMTSYKPIYIETHPGFKPFKDKHNRTQYTLPQGIWYSDYKSASSVERIEAFIKLGRPDPAPYADEKGPASWEIAEKHVKQVLLKNDAH